METGIEGVGPSDSWSALIFTRVLPGSEALTRAQLLGRDALPSGQDRSVGHVFVIERHRRNPLWKLPGGHKQGGEAPLQTAIRELHGETGILLLPEAFHYCAKWRREGRDRETQEISCWWDLLFVALMRESDCQWMNTAHEQNEGEEPKYFTVAEFRRMLINGEFMDKHYVMLAEAMLIL